MSSREREVAALIAQGLTDRQIAERLVIIEGTAGVHVSNILNKLGVHAPADIPRRYALSDEETQAAVRPPELAAATAGPTLSPRERQVALLVAEGLTNRQIAERLIVSERTAAAHVEHIMAKLGFTSRTQIGVWAAGRRLVPGDFLSRTPT